jgi:hypothetical protein
VTVLHKEKTKDVLQALLLRYFSLNTAAYLESSILAEAEMIDSQTQPCLQASFFI